MWARREGRRLPRVAKRWRGNDRKNAWGPPRGAERKERNTGPPGGRRLPRVGNWRGGWGRLREKGAGCSPDHQEMARETRGREKREDVARRCGTRSHGEEENEKKNSVEPRRVGAATIPTSLAFSALFVKKSDGTKSEGQTGAFANWLVEPGSAGSRAGLLNALGLTIATDR